MPPAFVPIIGSGFDADAAQQFQWAQFSRAQEEANIARQNQAARDYNNWLQQNSMLGREDARYADQVDRQDEQSRYGRAVAARNMAESQRQFDAGVKLQEQHYANEASRWKFANDERTRQEKQGLSEVESAAENLAPEYNTVRKTVDDLQSTVTKHEKDVITGASRIYSELKPEERGLIVYDGRRQFKPTPLAVNNPKALEAANAANAKLADTLSAFDESSKNLKFYQTRLAELHRTLGSYRLLTKKDGDNYVIISPLHNNKVFKGLVEEAKKSNPLPPAADATTGNEVSDEEGSSPVGYVPTTEQTGSTQASIKGMSDAANGASSFWLPPPAQAQSAPVSRRYVWATGPDGRRHLVPQS